MNRAVIQNRFLRVEVEERGAQLLSIRTADGVEFQVSGPEDAQITLGMEEDTEYVTQVDGHESGRIKTGLGGKLSVSVPLEADGEVPVKVVQI